MKLTESPSDGHFPYYYATEISGIGIGANQVSFSGDTGLRSVGYLREKQGWAVYICQPPFHKFPLHGSDSRINEICGISTDIVPYDLRSPLLNIQEFRIQPEASICHHGPC